MTMAPRVGWGTYCMTSVANTSTKAMTAAPTTPVTWERDPACSDTAVRDPLVLTGKPWNRPAAMFAAPIPIISWSPRTRSPRRAAKEDAVDIVSASATTAIATAPSSSAGMSPHGTVGTVKGGNPWGSTPTVDTPSAWRSRRLTASAATTTTRRTDGIFGRRRCSRRIPTSEATPSTAAVVLASSSPVRNAVASSMSPSASTEKPNSLGSWPMTMVSASPFMYPIWVGLERRSATKPKCASPAIVMTTPTRTASTDAYATARSGSPPARARGAMVAAIIGPSEESGPSTRMRDGPNAAYPRRQRMEV
jgi:hypothetical protein